MNTIIKLITESDLPDHAKEKIFTIIAAPNNVKLLTKLIEPEIVPELDDTVKVMFLDTETTGLNPELDSVIELGYVVTQFTKQGEYKGVISCYNGLQEPPFPISDNIAAITGIKQEDLIGTKLDMTTIQHDLSKTVLCIAHNASFDRKFVEGLHPLFSTRRWACTYADIDWKALNISSSKLEFIGHMCGFYFDAHRAINDVFAMLEAVRLTNTFSQLFAAAQKSTYVLSAIGAPFDSKDMLKERKYKPKYAGKKFVCWYTNVATEEQMKEEKVWLMETAKCTCVPVKEVLPFERFSVRETL